MPSARRHARAGAAVAVALTIVALALLDALVQQQLGASLATAGLAAAAGPGGIGLGSLAPTTASLVAVDLAHAQAALTWQYGGALVIGLGTAAVLLNGGARRLAAWFESRVPRHPVRGLPAR
jgi:hypothetical protein